MLELQRGTAPAERASLADLAPPGEREVVEALVAPLEHFCRDHIDPRGNDHHKCIPPGVLDGLREMGLFGLSLPESHGGAGLSLWATGSIAAIVARRDRSVATTLGLHLGLGTRGLVTFGTPAQKDRYLPRLATGEILAAFATTEPAAGSDLSALRCTLSEVEGALSVRGQKCFVTNGALASLYTVSTRSPGLGGARKGQTLVLLERGDPGLCVGAEEEKLGLRASSTTMLDCDDVPVAPDRILGPMGQGANVLQHVLAYGRTVMAFGCTGTARAALDPARTHCAIRVQFGRTLDQLAVVREQLADMAAKLFAIEALVRWAACDDSQLEWRSLAAKVLASDLSGEIVDTALQLHGGYGFIEETGIALLSRDARITRIFEGANDVLRVHRGLFALGQPPAGPLAARCREAIAEARAQRGVRLLGDHVTLHRLGTLAMLADAAAAAKQRADDEGTAEARALATRWLRLSEAYVPTLPDDTTALCLGGES